MVDGARARIFALACGVKTGPQAAGVNKTQNWRKYASELSNNRDSYRFVSSVPIARNALDNGMLDALL